MASYINVSVDIDEIYSEVLNEADKKDLLEELKRRDVDIWEIISFHQNPNILNEQKIKIFFENIDDISEENLIKIIRK